MFKIRNLILTMLACAPVAGAIEAAPALASHSQAMYFEASTQLLSPSTRARTIGQLQHLGVKALRIEMSWADVAPASRSAAKPAFKATDPSAYAWGTYGEAIAEAARLHWQVLLTVTSPVPRWATSNRKAPYITRPDGKDFQEFMTAVGLHFGSQVSLYSVWNEPNHPAFLLPQWNSNGTPASPRIYRGLFQAAYAGLQAAGQAHPHVLFGETAPTGYTTVNVRREGSRALLHDVAPLAFLRGALCLNASYHRAGGCSMLQMSGYAHHAYTLPAGPYYAWPQADDVTIGSLSRLSRALDLAARQRAIPGGVPIYLTEFGVQSVPNRELGVSAATQAQFQAIDERIAWSNGRVAAFSQYLLRDDPLGGPAGSSVHGGTVGFQTGLQYLSGKLKPLYFSFPVPLTITRSGRSYSLWGLVRPTTGATTVSVYVKTRSSRSYKLLKKVATSNLGYWTLRSSVAGQYWRVRWTSPSGPVYEGPPVAAY
jgi:hypothetical protein